jgi:hypothetical protein
MDRKPVATIKPITIWDGDAPTKLMVNRATRRCRFHFSIVLARKKPPMKRKTTSSAYVAVTFLAVIMCSSGYRAIGSREVAGIGIASVIHQIAMSTVTAASLHAATDSPSGAGRISITTKRIKPRKKPILRPLNKDFIKYYLRFFIKRIEYNLMTSKMSNPTVLF